MDNETTNIPSVYNSIEEEGVVIESSGNSVVIRTERTTACDSCRSKNLCHSSGDDEDTLTIEAENPVHAKVGDRVVFSVEEGAALKAGLIIYLYPLISFIIGAAAGSYLGESFLPEVENDFFALFGGLIVMTLAFLSIKFISGTSSERQFRPVVVRVVRGG